MQYNKVIKNPVMEVFWAGWRSDTLTLQEHGWQLSVHEDPMRMALRIALHHPAFHLYGIMLDSVRYEMIHGRDLPRLVISHIAHDIQFRRLPVYDNPPEMFQPFDARPQYSQCFEHEIKSISDMKIFRPLNAIQEIVVESQNVDELLGKILSMQSPRQAELREKARLEERRNKNVYDIGQYREVYNPKTDIIAQVISI